MAGSIWPQECQKDGQQLKRLRLLEQRNSGGRGPLRNTGSKKERDVQIFNIYKAKKRAVPNSIEIFIQFIQWAEGREEVANPQPNMYKITYTQQPLQGGTAPCPVPRARGTEQQPQELSSAGPELAEY